MKPQRGQQCGSRRRRGTALFTVLVVVVTASTLLGTMTTMGLSRSFTARKLSERVQAIAIAEAGANHAYSILATNFLARTNAAAFPMTAYGGGSYDVTVTPVGDSMASILSTGICGTVTETVILDVRRYGGEEITPDAAAFDYAIVSGGETTWTGSGEFLGEADVHSNRKFKQAGSGVLNADVSSSVEVNLNGNSGSIDGDVSAPQITGKTSKITGGQDVGPVPEVAIPEIDLTPYYNTALANGQVYGSLTLTGGFSPPGGIVWVNGNLHISSSVAMTACFIATGEIKVSGSGTINRFSTYPGLISRDGDIKITGSATLNGLIYSRIGMAEFSGGGRVNGTVICGGEFKKSGSSTVFSYVDSTPQAPGAVDAEYALGVSAWQK